MRAAGRIENDGQIAQIVVGTRNGVPIHVSDIATVGVGAELRTGSASENGEEVVVGKRETEPLTGPTATGTQNNQNNNQFRGNQGGFQGGGGGFRPF